MTEKLFALTGFMNERPEYALAPQWAETGDRFWRPDLS